MGATGGMGPGSALRAVREGGLRYACLSEGRSSCRRVRGRTQEDSRRPPRRTGWPGASYVAGAARVMIGEGPVGEPVEPAAGRVALYLLVEARGVECLEPGA